ILKRFERAFFPVFTTFVFYWVITGMVGYPWNGILLQLIFVLFVRAIRPSPTKVTADDRFNLADGDVYIVSEVAGRDPEGRYPGGRWLVKRNSTISASPRRHRSRFRRTG